MSGSWPQLTPWGRFFKLSGYTAGKSVIGNSLQEKERLEFVPVGLLGQVGITVANQPNNALGETVIAQNGAPIAYAFAGEIGTRVTDFLGVFYEYQIGNTLPGWKGSGGPVDIRAVHFFHPSGNELLLGVDTNNNPAEQDVFNSMPGPWGYPFYSSPQAPAGPASPMIASLGAQAGGVGAYALLNRQWYAEVSFYRVANDLFRWMSAGTSFQAGGKNYLQGYNPYWRAYWTKEKGPQSLMIGTFGLHSKVYPDSSLPSGPTNVFTDSGVDAQYQYLADIHKVTLRASYLYEDQQWNADFLQGASSNAKGNLKSLNLNGSYGYRNQWILNAGYFSAHGNNNAARYAITDSSGNQLTASPNTSGYVLEVDRLITQNVQATLQYKGFGRFNGLTDNVDGMGRRASANNTLWMTIFFAY